MSSRAEQPPHGFEALFPLPGAGSLAAVRAAVDPGAAGRAMHDLLRELLPLPRSITGDGVRRTLAAVGRHVPLDLHEVPSGTPVLDWTVPAEWNVRAAWLEGPDGRRVLDLADTPLHVMGYSGPVRARMPLAQLREHLHTDPSRPGAVPYRTSFYRETWGLCLSQDALDGLVDGEYEVCIDSTLAPGSLTYAECVVRGTSEREVLLSCHTCHPGLANDNLSGLVLVTALAQLLALASPRLTYRIVMAPSTIGAITWLAQHEDVLPRIAHGLVVSGVGDPGPLTYKRTRRADAPVDRAVEHVLAHRGEHRVVDFSPWGYDERQYGSPGYDLPVGCLSRTPHGQYPGYHTSDDDASLVRPEALADSLDAYLQVVEVLEGDDVLLSTNPRGEPQLGRRGLYPTTGGAGTAGADLMSVLWVLNTADGSASLLDTAVRSGLPFAQVRAAADDLLGVGLLAPLAAPAPARAEEPR